MTTVAPQEFGALLLRHRRHASLTQEALAEQAGLSVRGLSDLERGVSRPRKETIDLLVQALGLSAGERAVMIRAARRLDARSAPPAAGPTGPAAASAGTGMGTDTEQVANLPVPFTPFIGREREVAAVRARLLQPQTRLLTLTGPGGVGKTRLALQVAAAVQEAFADGVVFVPLAAITDPDLVLPTIAQALDVVEAGGQALRERLSEALRRRTLLLVLDNFEQVLAAAPQVKDVLAACPGVRALVTSRAALHVQGEREYGVPPLAVPPPSQWADLQVLSQEAVQLFVARAQDVQPDFAVTGETAPLVAEICVRLDGLPLAIELAAARTRLLPPQALLARLQQRLRVLTGGPQDLPARQQTMRAAVAWSYDLLEPGEQMLFARLAVFVGGCTLEAVEAVCNADGALPLDALDGIESLLDNSLLRREDGVEGEPRLVMLETIHEFAWEQLAGRGEVEALQRAHAAYFLGLAETAAPELMGPHQTRWLARLEAEHDNLRTALGWARTNAETALGLRLAAALGRFWEARGHLREGRTWLEGFLAHLDDTAGESAAAATALHRAGSLAFRQGDYRRATTLFEESLAIKRRLGDILGVAHVLNNLAGVAQYRGDYTRAMALLEESAALKQEMGDRRGVASTLNNLGLLAFYQGEYERAMDLHEQSVALHREIGDTLGSANALMSLGMLLYGQGTYERATTLFEQSLALRRTVGDRMGIAQTLNCLGLVRCEQRCYEAATALHEESLALQRDIGDTLGVANSLAYLARAAYGQGRLDHAVASYHDSLRLYQAIEDTLGIVHCLEGLAHVAARRGRLQNATQLLGAATAWRESSGARRLPVEQIGHEQVVARLRHGLGDEVFAAAWTMSQAWSIDEALACAAAQTS